uniref:Beta-sarcoglycan n=1 Tax=Dermatophagoides pteronyssinus TaxID=6956 RepID=A0A6P6XWE8_DERPT|nr:beta-sarcoglycan-like [Dermatophagoides pteronyssinus]
MMAMLPSSSNRLSIDDNQNSSVMMSKTNNTNHHKEILVTIIIALLIISIATTITLLAIIYRLRLIPGFEYFTIIDDNVILHKDTYIDRILLSNNRISGLSSITGNICLESGQSSLRINNDGIRLRSKKGLEIRSSSNGQLLFPFDLSSLPLNSIKTLSVPNGIRDVKMIRSPLNEDLNIISKGKIRIRGNEGVNVEGKQIKLDAKNIFLSSLNASIIMDGHKGIYLDMNSFKSRIVHRRQESSSTSENEKMDLQYKLCICGRNGQLFRMAIKDSSSSCADARFPQSDNPCL